MESESIRQQKIARQIQSDMAEIFQREGKPCTLGTLLTVTAVRVSPDFGYAKIYLSVFPFNRGEEVLRTVEEKNWFLRRELGRRVKHQLKVVPELQFFLDDSLEYIRNIEEKLKE
uniref:30S ribosome-binding factor RbfA n=1 Tax=Alistipes sp. TaxID=1872444 RepID=UPI004057BF70